MAARAESLYRRIWAVAERIPRGRVATAAAWRHFGLALPGDAGPDLWSGDGGALTDGAGD